MKKKYHLNYFKVEAIFFTVIFFFFAFSIGFAFEIVQFFNEKTTCRRIIFTKDLFSVLHFFHTPPRSYLNENCKREQYVV